VDDKIRAMEKSRDKSAAPAQASAGNSSARRLATKPVARGDKKNLPRKGERPIERANARTGKKPPRRAEPRVFEAKLIAIPKLLTVKQLAEAMGVAGQEVVRALVRRGDMLSINNEIEFEKAAEIAELFNCLVEEEIEVDLFEKNFSESEDDPEDTRERPPVVVVMGHVDHGKTSLLDRIRNTAVTQGEHGGITQHIGAYTVEINGKTITFLDTPGHEAFTAMRMRGASVTDIAVLVVAADDGVMPQTIEAINHAKAAGVEIIVAINKIDKPAANPERVKQELTEYELVTTEWGGSTECVNVSAKNGIGIEDLLETIIVTAELKELRANPKKSARGTVIEAQLDKGRGPVATVLVQSGTLRVGDPVVTGGAFGKIRAMTDSLGRKVKEAGPSKPVELLGLSDVPAAGDMFYAAESEKHARQVSEQFIALGRVEMTKSQVHKVSLDDLFSQIKAGSVKDLNLIIKADVQGSVEALRQSLEKLTNDEVRVRILHGGVGAVNESDVMLASASGAIILAFNVKPEPAAKQTASEQNVDLRQYNVIYNAIEDVELAMKGMLEPVYEERVIGHAEIRQLFKASSVGTIAGSFVLDGKATNKAKARVFRGSGKVYEGGVAALRRFKDDVKEVAAGFECGILLSKFNEIQTGDTIEFYVIEEVPR
jgi:translation initiation factor IF-2